MKKNSDEKVLQSEALSLLSILTLIFAFVLVCAACLFVLWRFDAFEFPWRENAERQVTLGDAEYDDVLKNLHSKNGSGGTVLKIEADYETVCKKIISSLNDESFHIECEVTDASDGDAKSYKYDLWRCDDKYRVIKYDFSMNVVMDVVCNGKIVNVTYLGEGKRVFTINEASFERFSPIPDLSILLDEQCRPVYSDSSDGEYQLICEYGETDVIDIKVSMGIGVIRSVRLFKNSQTVVNVDVTSVETGISAESFLD